ncbi:MAG: AMP-binding protein [Bacteroidales bacterium]|nr:AMP-binding protein [Candidatus Physcousia equi]
MEIPSLNQMIAESIQKHWDMQSMSDYGDYTYQYKDVARVIEKMHILFETTGIKKGDRIALCGRNSARWGAAFFSVLSYGAVCVPILNEFHPQQIQDIVNHSETRLLFVTDQIFSTLDFAAMPQLEGCISFTDYTLLESRSEELTNARNNLNKLFGEKFPNNFRKQHISYHVDKPDELAIINYTSGTTSNSKGVMIPYRAIWSNIDFADTVLSPHINPGDNILSMLPMAHEYGMAFEFIYEFWYGIHIYFLTKMPSPVILLKALADIKPCVLICVPLIIEKVVRKAVLPKIQDPKVRLMLNVPIIGDRIKKKILEGMKQAFGGRYYEVIVGGAAFNQEIETILHDVGFNYTVGYGATECAPIICYEDWKKFKKGSCGKAAKNMQVRIDSPDPANVPGEILAKGPNVMLGYYKNEEATAATLDKDGWYHTGDLGIMDDEGNVTIKGRCKTMLLGANGQNIYPEEIEDKLSNVMLVSECLVIQRNEKLYGLVYPDMEQAAKLNLSTTDLEAVMEQNRKELNTTLPNYCQLAGIRIVDKEFEKTPKKSIKRYKYTDYPV